MVLFQKSVLLKKKKIAVFFNACLKSLENNGMSEAKDKMNLRSPYSKKQLLLKLFLPLFVSLGLIIFAAYFLVVKNYISNNKELEKKIIELNNVEAI